ncbi:MAG: DUF3990 domain-containing protein [Coriobacteriales bacterium]|nr:DUF3990 domain-containing protein [Coriobacteriales bacterium]
MESKNIRLYHGSNAAIERPDVSHNTGFADLGCGFYLTNDYEVACRRAASRARRMGGEPMVSVFDFNEGCIPWVAWGETVLAASEVLKGKPFGLRFEANPAGIVAWAKYIKSCRKGMTEIPEWGGPAVVRAWIATEEVEMVCSGFVPAEDLAEFINPDDLVVQYCLLEQQFIDEALTFVEAERLN